MENLDDVLDDSMNGKERNFYWWQYGGTATVFTARSRADFGENFCIFTNTNANTNTNNNSNTDTDTDT